MRTERLRVGVVGVGGISRDQHLPAWARLPFVELAAFADLSPEALEQAGDRFNVAQRYRDWQPLVERTDVDVVDICTPNRTHTAIALAALANGKHVLCEKPLATTSDEVLLLQDAARKAGKLLMTAQSTRYKAASRQLKALIDGGMLGKIYYTRAQYLRRRFLPPRPTFTEHHLSGGGPVMDIGVHILDLAYWFLGCPEPVSVSAFVDAKLAHRTDLGGTWGDWDRSRFDVEDFAVGFIRFADGATLTLESSWLGFQPEKELIRLQCYGTHGGLVWPDGILLGETNKTPWNLRVDETVTDDVYYEEIKDFAVAIRDGLPSPVPVEQTLNVTRILEAMYQSGRTRAEVVLDVKPILRMSDAPAVAPLPMPAEGGPGLASAVG